jgi:hypothetical protein
VVHVEGLPFSSCWVWFLFPLCLGLYHLAYFLFNSPYVFIINCVSDAGPGSVLIEMKCHWNGS